MQPRAEGACSLGCSGYLSKGIQDIRSATTGANDNRPGFDYLAGMDQPLSSLLQPGARVKVTQQIAGRDFAWTSEVRGTVLAYEQKQTGSWYAHSRGDKLWLDRLSLRKDDGELITLNLDEFSRVEVEQPAPAGAPTGTAKANETDLPV